MGWRTSSTELQPKTYQPRTPDSQKPSISGGEFGKKRRLSKKRLASVDFHGLSATWESVLQYAKLAINAYSNNLTGFVHVATTHRVHFCRNLLCGIRYNDTRLPTHLEASQTAAQTLGVSLRERWLQLRESAVRAGPGMGCCRRFLVAEMGLEVLAAIIYMQVPP